MADETKKYLINIESNLNKYAEEAADVKKKVDDLKTSNELLKQSGTASAKEIEASNSALRNAQKEYNHAKKLVDLQTTANNSNANSRKQLAAIVDLEKYKLGQLSNTIVLNSRGQRVLSDEYKKAVKNLDDAKKAVIAYDKAQADGRSNVGRYGESIKSSFKSIGTSLLGFTSITALAVAGLAKLKEAFQQTEKGAKFFGRSAEILKTVFQGIVSGDNLKEVLKNAILVNVAAEKGDEIRKGNRKDLKEIARLETEIEKLNLSSQDATKSKAEQQEALVELQAKELELIDYKKKDLQEELDYVNERLLRRKDDTELLNEQARLEAEILRLEGDRSLRVERRLSTLRQQEIDQARKDKEKAEKEMQEAKEKFDKELTAYRKGLDDQRQADKDAAERRKQDAADLAAWEFERKLLNQENLLSIRESQNDWEFDLQRKRLSIQELAEIDSAKRTGADLNIIHGKYSAARIAIDEAEHMAKLQLAAGFAGNLAQIFGENTALGKAAAIAETTINTYASATAAFKSMAGVPVVGPTLGAIAAGAAIAAGLANVKKIVSVKSGLPGDSGSGPSSIPSAQPVHRIAALSGATIFNNPQLSQMQLNALPQNGQLTIEQLVEAFKKLPAPVTTIEDINARQKSTNKIVDRSRI